MQKTIADIKSYIALIMKDYPGFSHNAYPQLVEEINSVQQLYFERFCHESGVFEAVHTAAFAVEIPQEEGMAAPSFSDILAVFLDDVQIPFLDEVSYKARKDAAATMRNGKIVYRADNENYQQVTVIYKKRPQDIVYANDSISGGIYIPLKHLPLLGNKIRAFIASSILEYKDADYYTEAYNNWIAVLDGYENGTHRVSSRLRAAL